MSDSTFLEPHGRKEQHKWAERTRKVTTEWLRILGENKLFLKEKGQDLYKVKLPENRLYGIFL